MNITINDSRSEITVRLNRDETGRWSRDDHDLALHARTTARSWAIDNGYTEGETVSAEVIDADGESRSYTADVLDWRA